MKYRVYYAADGCAQEYIGDAASLRAARRLAAEHGRGDRFGSPEALWQTARAAAGSGTQACRYPGQGQSASLIEAREPRAWIGRGARYAVVPLVSLP